MVYTIQTRISRLLSILFLLAAGFLCYTQAQSNDDIEVEQRSSSCFLNGEITVALSKQQTELGHFKIETLKTTSYQPEHSVSGKVLSIQPLLELQNKLNSVAINLLTAQQQEKFASAVLKRAQKLAAEGITSAAKTQKLKQDWLTLHSSIQTYQSQQNYLQASAEQRWGKKLAESITKPNPQLTELLSGNSALLSITVPPSVSSVDPTRSISISIDGQREHSVSAEYVSASPVSDQIAGNSYFYVAHASKLQTGKRVMAWISVQTNISEGVLIPESAIT